MEKQRKQPESEISLDKVREERRRAREHEVGYQLGQSVGTHIRSTTAVMLPIQMALAPVLLTLGGWWLDDKLETSPWFTIGGLLFGLSVAVLSLVRYLKEVRD